MLMVFLESLIHSVVLHQADPEHSEPTYEIAQNQDSPDTIAMEGKTEISASAAVVMTVALLLHVLIESV